jgi:dolichyl-phosphate beta-glucosyltransferase
MAREPTARDHPARMVPDQGYDAAPMEKPTPSLSVVVPAYNEERRLGPTLDRIATHLRSRGEPWELIVVDDGSKDGTREVAADAARRHEGVVLLPLPRNRGKGVAVRTGFVAARGRLVLFSDADLSTPIEDVAKLEAALARDGSAIAIGSRALPDSDVRVKQHRLRQLLGQGFNVLVRGLAGLKQHDTQCGFKLFRRDECLPLFLAQRIDGFAFDAELLFLAQRTGLRVSEVPVTWVNSPDSRVHVLRDPLLMLKDLVRIRCNALLGRYDEVSGP